MNRACTCTLVKDGDTGNFVGRKGKKKKSRREIPLCNSQRKIQQQIMGARFAHLLLCCMAKYS